MHFAACHGPRSAQACSARRHGRVGSDRTQIGRSENCSKNLANSKGLFAKLPKHQFNLAWLPSSSLSLAVVFSSSSSIFLSPQSFLTSLHLSSPPSHLAIGGQAIRRRCTAPLHPNPPKYQLENRILSKLFFFYSSHRPLLFISIPRIFLLISTQAIIQNSKPSFPPCSNLQQVIPPSAVQLLQAGTSPWPSSSLFLPPSTAPSTPLSQEPKTLLSFTRPGSTASRPTIWRTSSLAINSLHRPPLDPRRQRRPPLPPVGLLFSNAGLDLLASRPPPPLPRPLHQIQLDPHTLLLLGSTLRQLQIAASLAIKSSAAVSSPLPRAHVSSSPWPATALH